MSAVAGAGWFWPAVLLIAAGTFFFRAVFLHGLVGRELSPPVARALKLVPTAALSALIVTTVAAGGSSGDGASMAPRLLAAAIALAVALWRRNMFLTIAVGMAALWILQRTLS